MAAACRSYCAISTSSRTSTTRSDTPGATRCCGSSAHACSRICGGGSEGALASALEGARKLRVAVASTPFTYDRKNVEVTASFGLCGLDRVPAGERQLAQRVL